MGYPSYFFTFILTLLVCHCTEKPKVPHYPSNPSPLVQTPFVNLPLGTIQPQGWLKDQLLAQKNGLTGHLEDFWPDLMNSAWRGGEGESWERGPYYLDGLIPLAYLLNDQTLKDKAQNWIESIIKSQRDDGWFGPDKNADRWPLALTCKAISQYYEATDDPRALNLIEKYFEYLHRYPPDWPDSTWRGVRAMEHTVTGYWLYRRTKNPQILETIKSIFENSYDWTNYLYSFPWDSTAISEKRIPHNWGRDGLTAHVVNNAMAIKYPGLWYLQSGDEWHKQAVFKGINNYDRHHGQIGGRFSGDEHLSGKRPTQGTEMCAIIEYMYSLENLTQIFADVSLADRLELLAYNALPAMMTPDCWAHQYDQQANQVLVSYAKRIWSTNGPAANLFGLMPNYPCCLANLHQGWPKFVSHMWMATEDRGLALIAYGPSEVTARVGDNRKVKITEKTHYPFENSVALNIEITRPTEFPIYVRIPDWAKGCIVRYRGKTLVPAPGQFLPLIETWKNNDTIILVFPMSIEYETRYNQAIAIRRGPLYYALRIGKEFKSVKLKAKAFKSIPYKGSKDWEIYPTTKWNYALILNKNEPGDLIEIYHNPVQRYPFSDVGDQIYNNTKNRFEIWKKEAPIVMALRGQLIPHWKLNQNSAADPPLPPFKIKSDPQELYLVPYGCTRLRIAEFPVLPD